MIRLPSREANIKLTFTFSLITPAQSKSHNGFFVIILGPETSFERNDVNKNCIIGSNLSVLSPDTYESLVHFKSDHKKRNVIIY